MDPFVGEIRIFASGVIPDGWLPCDGRAMPINDNQALFSLLGFEFGGDQMSTFNLPDLRGGFPIQFGPTHIDHQWIEGVKIGQSAKSTGAARPTVAVAYGIAVRGYFATREQ